MTDSDDTEGRCIGDWRLEIGDFVEGFLDIVAYGLGVAARAGGPADGMRCTIVAIDVVKTDGSGAYQAHGRTGEKGFVYFCACTHDKHIGLTHCRGIDLLRFQRENIDLRPVLTDGFNDIRNMGIDDYRHL